MEEDESGGVEERTDCMGSITAQPVDPLWWDCYCKHTLWNHWILI